MMYVPLVLVRSTGEPAKLDKLAYHSEQSARECAKFYVFMAPVETIFTGLVLKMDQEEVWSLQPGRERTQILEKLQLVARIWVQSSNSVAVS